MTGSGLRAAAGRILWVDALGALGAGTLVLLLDHQLAAWYRMPLTVVTGLALANVGYGSMSFALALVPRWRRPAAVWLLIVANWGWLAVCLLLLGRHGGAASGLGVAHLLVEGVYVAALGTVEWRVRQALIVHGPQPGPQLHLLECRVPPPVVVLVVAAGMWRVTRVWPGTLPPGARLAGPVLAVLGAVLALWGVLAFRRASTTVHPLHPEQASALVIAGPNRWTRNPMYVGMLLALAGWGVWLGGGVALAGVAAAWAWLHRFQVLPEERALAARFGAAYDAYRAQVRRWG
jgi:protein-S-isoprenylcysteine O-methyltransferase Ste14